MSWFQRLKSGLRQSSGRLQQPLKTLLKNTKLTPEILEAMEEILIQSDAGVTFSLEVTQKISKMRFDSENMYKQVSAFLANLIEEKLLPFQGNLIPSPQKKPWVVLLVGVNGSGKTTTTGKLACHWRAAGLKVGIVACDTFRAAAVQQLQIWAERANAPFYKAPPGRDSAALAFESFQKARQENLDVLLIDTAGRLQNKSHLMDELTKIVRTLNKQDATLPHSCLLVLDATTGQNAMSQARLFSQAVPLSGFIVTKLDGTAKGGILLNLTEEFRLPIPLVGVGEDVDDLQPFNAHDFAQALMGIEPAVHP